MSIIVQAIPVLYFYGVLIAADAIHFLMAINRVQQIHESGQRIWLNFIDRKIIVTGVLLQLVDEDGLRGITPNPAIFEADTSKLDLSGATKTLQWLAGAGIDLATLTQQLEEEGIEKFNVPYQKSFNAIETQRAKALA